MTSQLSAPVPDQRLDQLSPDQRVLLARLAAQRRRSARPEPGIARLAPGEQAPCSFEQRRMWLAGQIDPTGGSTPNAAFGLRMAGRLDRAAITGAVQYVVDRHDVLRTAIIAGQDEPYPVIRPTEPCQLSEVDLSGVAAGEREAAARRMATAAAAERFDLTTGPLFRFTLLRLGDDDHVLLFVCHHIAFDGWSAGVLVSELAACYRALVAGAPADLPPLPVRYADYATWSRARLAAGTLTGRLRFWDNYLAGATPAGTLPVTVPRPAEGGQSECVPVHLPGAFVDALCYAGTNTTPFAAVLTVFATVLARYTGQDDLTIGTMFGGRPRAELEALVGCFVNPMVVRADLRGDPTFAEAARRVRQSLTMALANDLPFDELVSGLQAASADIAAPRVGVVQVGFANDGSLRDGPVAWPGLAVSAWDTDVDDTLYDLAILVIPNATGITVAFKYRTDVYDRPAIERLATHFETVARSAAGAPATRVSELHLLAPAEREQLLYGWNRTTRPFPDQATLTSLIATQIKRLPDRVAVACDGKTLTYAELDARANRVAHRLRRAGVGPETIVAVCAERSVELVAGLLGILKASAAYLPLDPEYPPERLAFMLDDAAPAVVLTQRRVRDVLPAGTGGDGREVPVLLLDDEATWADEPADDLPDLAGPDNAVYVIYTSGSTGVPKGVVTVHRAIVNRLHWMQQIYSLHDDDCMLQKTPISFDPSVWELFWPLMTGARLVLAAPGEHRDAARLRDLIIAERVTTLHMVPSMLPAFLAEDGVESCTSIRRLFCGGEALPVDLVRSCLATLPGVALHNVYGPTEAAIEVSDWHCAPDALAGLARVPIGAPMQNVALYVLDGHLRPAPVDVPGQLFIGGVAPARGYLNRPALTAERFVPDPYGVPGSRMYATGDLARWRADGTIDFLGRGDNQVKIRGVRIELGEIEAALRAAPGVRKAAAVVHSDGAGEKRLVAYVVPADGVLDAAELRAFLAARLPANLVPNAFVPLAALPLSPSGKLDRRALPPPEFDRSVAAEFVAPRTPNETVLAEVWREVLGLREVGIDDDFLELGGHSLLAIQVVARLRGRLHGPGGPVGVLDLYQHRTIRRIAESVDGCATDRGLLVKLTAGARAAKTAVTFVCVPFGGGSAAVYQPLADALPKDCALWSVALPGHDIGRADERPIPFDEAARRCAEEIIERVDGPLVLYGHCVGSALTIEIARRLEAAGRTVDAVYVGGSFPFALPSRGVLGKLARIMRSDRFNSDAAEANRLRGIGADLAGLSEEEVASIVRVMRVDARAGEDYFTRMLDAPTKPLRAPVISVVGEQDSITEFYQERYREWHVVTGTTALVVIDEAGHYFLRYRAAELAEIVTSTHHKLDTDTGWGHQAGRTWWRHAKSTDAARETGPQPSLGRLLAVAGGQLVSMTASAITQFALPIWAYLQTGSLVQFSLFAIVALVPGLVLGPLLGALIDRSDKRRAMVASDVAGLVVIGAVLLLLSTDNLRLPSLYGLLSLLSIAATGQRLTWTSVVPQLAPKALLGHANGVVQLGNAVSRVMVPLFAVGLLAWVKLEGILLLDIVSYVFVVVVVLTVQFPQTMAWRRRETVQAEIAGGFRLLWRNRGLRAMMLLFFVINLFLLTAFIMVSPLVLATAGLREAGWVATVAGVGSVCGGIAMTVWGGPRRRKMLGLLTTTAVVAACCAFTGIRPSLAVVAVGVFGMSFAMILTDGIWLTILHTKVPQRYHARAIGINQLIAMSTQPIGLALQAWLAGQLFEPLLAPGGPLASTVGRVIGVGPGRGIGLLYLLCGLAMGMCVLVALRAPALARFDYDTPDAEPDDVVGLRALTGQGSDVVDAQPPQAVAPR